MAKPNNRFLNEKDRKKAENDLGNVYSSQIDEIMRGKMASSWTPSSDNDIKRTNLPSIPKENSINAKQYVNELKKKDEEKRFTQQKAEEKAAAKRSNNPYVRSGKQTQADADKRQAEGKRKYEAAKEKYPILKQTDAVFNNTVKPLTEGMLKASGDTIGELATIGNDEGKENLRNYLDERERSQKGFQKVAYKTGEIGTNLALMSSISNKLPFINKLDTLTKSNLVNKALREGAENVIINGATDFAKGDTEDFATDRLKDFGGGALFGAGMHLGGKAISKFTKAKNVPYEPNIAEPKVEEVIKPITDFTPTRQMDLLGEEPAVEQLNFKEAAGVKNPTNQVKSTGRPIKQSEGQTSLFDNEPKMLDNEQLNLNDVEPIRNTPVTNKVPKVPTKYDVQNPNGKMKPHVVGGNFKETPSDPAIRDFDNIGKDRKIKAMGFNHPELREHIEPEAYALKEEFKRFEFGGIGNIKDENGFIIDNNDMKANIGSEDIKQLLALTPSPNAKQKAAGLKTNREILEKAINDVIEDNGKENYALAKRVEAVIDERLTKGYTDDIYGEEIPPYENYINTKNQVYGEGENYSKIPKIAEREKILKRFNEEYGNLPPAEPPQARTTTGQVNTPPQTKPSQNLNSEVLDDTLLNVYSMPKNDYKYDDVYKDLKARVNEDYEPSEEELENTFTNIYPPFKESVDKPVNNVKNIQTKSIDEDEILENQLEAEKVINSGKKVKLEKFGECEIVEETDGQIRLKNAKGTEFTIGEAAFEKLKVKETKQPPSIPSVKEQKIEPTELKKLEAEPKAKSEMAYTSVGDTATSKMRTNTYENAEFMQDPQAKKVVEKISGEYEVLHNKNLMEDSKMKLENDFENQKAKLIQKSKGEGNGLMNAEDIAQAGFLTKKLIEDSKISGDTESLKQFLRDIRIQVTSLGQSVQAISTWKKQTPEGMLLKAQKTVDEVVKTVKTENPKKFETATKMAEETKIIVEDIVNKIQQTEPKKPIEEILKTPSKTVDDIIETATKGKDKKVKEVIKEAVENKDIKNATKIAEKILEKNGVPSLTDSDIKFITEKMEKIQTLENGREKDIEYALVKKLIAEKIPPTTKDKLLAAQRINLLLNTRTNIRNITGNVVMAGLENVKDVVATPIDKVISHWSGKRTTTIPSISEQLQGFIKGAKEGLEDSKLGIDTSKMSGRYAELETNRMFDIPKAQAFRKIENPTTVVEHLNNLASGSEKLTHTLLSMGDRPFFEAAFSGSIAQQLKLNGGEVTEEMVERAIKDAEERTFQNVNELTKGMQWLKTGANKIGKAFTGTEFNIGDIALPFIKTPANILDKAKDYSPIGGVQGFTKIVTGLQKGNLNQKEAVDQLARGLTGTALIFAGYEMAKKGVIYGKGAKDKDARALEQQVGRLPYSIKSGDKYTTIDWIQPAAIPLMIGADIFESKKTEKEVDNIILSALKSGGKTLLDQSLLMGLTDLFGGYSTSGGENLMEGIKKTAINGLTQFVPYNSTLSQITKLTDTNVRNTYDESELTSNLVNRTKAKIPTLSDDLPKKYSTVGQEVKQNYGAKGLENAFHSLINPARTGKYNPTAAEKMALDIYDRSGETIQIPRVVGKDFNYKVDDGSKKGKTETYKLNGKDMSELQRIMGEKTEEAFKEISKNSKFEDMNDLDKAKELQDIMTKVKKEAENEFLDNKKIKYKN